MSLAGINATCVAGFSESTSTTSVRPADGSVGREVPQPLGSARHHSLDRCWICYIKQGFMHWNSVRLIREAKWNDHFRHATVLHSCLNEHFESSIACCCCRAVAHGLGDQIRQRKTTVTVKHDALKLHTWLCMDLKGKIHLCVSECNALKNKHELVDVHVHIQVDESERTEINLKRNCQKSSGHIFAA